MYIRCEWKKMEDPKMQRKEYVSIFITCSDKTWSNKFRTDQLKVDKLPRGAARTIRGMKKAVL